MRYRYLDDFRRGISVFAIFSYGIAVLGTPPMSPSNNSGSVEMWKCGNVEICLPCLCLITLEVWKCGNVEMWKYVFNVFI